LNWFSLQRGRAALLKRRGAGGIAPAGRVGPFGARGEAAERGVHGRVAKLSILHLAGAEAAGTNFRPEIVRHAAAPMSGDPPMPGGGLLSETRPGGGAAESGPCFEAWAIVARAAGT